MHLETLWGVDKFNLLFLLRCNKLHIKRKEPITKLDDELDMLALGRPQSDHSQRRGVQSHASKEAEEDDVDRT